MRIKGNLSETKVARDTMVSLSIGSVRINQVYKDDTNKDARDTIVLSSKQEIRTLIAVLQAALNEYND